MIHFSAMSHSPKLRNPTDTGHIITCRNFQGMNRELQPHSGMRTHQDYGSEFWLTCLFHSLFPCFTHSTHPPGSTPVKTWKVINKCPFCCWTNTDGIWLTHGGLAEPWAEQWSRRPLHKEQQAPPIRSLNRSAETYNLLRRLRLLETNSFQFPDSDQELAHHWWCGWTGRERTPASTPPPTPPPSTLTAAGVCREARRGQDGEQTTVCSPGEALTAALTRGVTLRFVWTRGQR